MRSTLFSTSMKPVAMALIGAFFVTVAVAQRPDGPRISISPGNVNLGGVAVGDVESKTVKVRNRGTQDLAISDISLCGGTSSEFGLSSSGGETLAPGSLLELEVTYAPIDGGVDKGCLTIVSDDPKNGVVEVGLRARGVEEEEPDDGPDISLKPQRLDFGEVRVGGSKTLGVKIKNKGSEALGGVMVGRCNGTSEEFSWDRTDMFTVPPDENVKVEVTYAPVDVGSDDGCLDIVSNDPDESSALLSVRGAGFEGADSGVDLDIHDFKVKRKIRLGSTQSVTPRLWIKNVGAVDDSKTAVVVGTQNGGVVYDEELLVSDRGGNEGKTKFEFPPFTPTAAGEILWMAMVEDDNPDDADQDEAYAVTQVEGEPADSVGLDLDAGKLKVTKKVSLQAQRAIRMSVWVRNNGAEDGTGLATLIGVQGGVQVYEETIPVSDRPGDGAATRFEFTSFAPGSVGFIVWTVTIGDVDADEDLRSAVTRVNP